MLECVPNGLIGAVESLARLRQGCPQRRPRFTSCLFQPLPRFGFGRVCLHVLEGGIVIGAPRGCHLCCRVMELVRRLTPSLHLSSRHVPERCLLLLDLLADGLVVGGLPLRQMTYTPAAVTFDKSTDVKSNQQPAASLTQPNSLLSSPMAVSPANRAKPHRSSEREGKFEPLRVWSRDGRFHQPTRPDREQPIETFTSS